MAGTDGYIELTLLLEDRKSTAVHYLRPEMIVMFRQCDDNKFRTYMWFDPRESPIEALIPVEDFKERIIECYRGY